MIKLENSSVKIARKILLGTLLGDSRIQPSWKTKAYFSMIHSNKQFEYIMWKAKKLVPLVGKFAIDEREVELRGKFYWRTQLRSYSSKYLKHIYDDFYFVRNGERKKEVHKNVLNRLTPISIAIFYGDDGNLHPGGSVRIATHGYTLNEIKLLCGCLKERFGFNFYPTLHHQSNLYGIKLNRGGSREFLEFVSPYLSEISCLKYKLDVNFKKSSDNSARRPGIDFWDDDVLRLPWKQGNN